MKLARIMIALGLIVLAQGFLSILDGTPSYSEVKGDESYVSEFQEKSRSNS